MKQQRELQVGEECWLLLGTLLYTVTVTEQRRCLESTPSEFVLYRVKPEHGIYSYLADKSQHRSDLFAKSDERDALKERIDSDIEALKYFKSELDENEEEETDG